MQNPQIYKPDYIKYLIIQNPLFYAKYLKYGFKIIIYIVYIYILREMIFQRYMSCSQSILCKYPRLPPKSNSF